MSASASIPFDCCVVYWWRLAQKRQCLPSQLPLVRWLVVVTMNDQAVLEIAVLEIVCEYSEL